MSGPRIGIIGGSGLGEALARSGGREVRVGTPFGPPSGPLRVTEWEGVEVAFLSRHGPGHLLNPSAVPYRANIFALKQLGVTHVVASGATGSLREEIAPKHLVVCDQVIDKTTKRASTFFDQGIVAHVEFAEPFCPTLRSVLNAAASAAGTIVHPKGTYVCMEGPAFSTVAESRMHRAWGGDLIGMTVMPEAKLAREAEMCYALVALPTDYDCWRPHDPGKDKQALLSEIIGNLEAVTAHATNLLRAAVPKIAEKLDAPCDCHNALELAIWSDKARVNRAIVNLRKPILGRYFT